MQHIGSRHVQDLLTHITVLVTPVGCMMYNIRVTMESSVPGARVEVMTA